MNQFGVITKKRGRPLLIHLNADAVLFDLTTDKTLDQLQDAHSELDRRAATVPAAAEEQADRFIMVVEDDGTDVTVAVPEPPATPHRPACSRHAQLEAIRTLREVMVQLHRDEVRTYAQQLQEAVHRQLEDLDWDRSVDVTVSSGADPGFVDCTHPRPVSVLPDPIQQAIASAIIETVTPAGLDGTLLQRAESRVYTAD